MSSEAQAVSEKAADAVLTDNSRVIEPLLCQQCKKIAVNCYQTRHGCRLCKVCVIDWQRQCDSAQNCPCGDDERIDPSDECLIGRSHCIPDIGGRREVNDLDVWCPNRGLGCSHTCKRRHVDKHLTTKCNFEMTKCDLCEQEVPLYHLDSHHKDLRSESCCSRFKAPCPLCNNNTCLLDRQAFLSHSESECPCAPIACAFSDSGCEWTGCRKDLEQHYKDSIVPHQLLAHSYCSSNHVRLKVVEDHLSKIKAGTSHRHASPDTQQELRNSATLTGSSSVDPVGVVENRRDLSHEIGNLSSVEVGNGASSSEQAVMMYLTGHDCEQILLQIFAQNPELIRSALLTEALHTDDSQNERVRKLAALANRCTSVHRSQQNAGQPARSGDGVAQLGDQDTAASDQVVQDASPIKLRRRHSDRPPSRTRMSAPPRTLINREF